MNYIDLLKEYSFIMIVIYLAVSNILFDTNIPWIVIIINFTNKVFIFNKNIHLGIIYEYIDISYIIIDFMKVFTAITITSIVVFELFIIV